MENQLKSYNHRPGNWYTKVIEKIGKEVVNTVTLSEIFETTDKELNTIDWRTQKKQDLRKALEEILGAGRYEYLEDTSVKVRGRSKGFLFSLKFNPGESVEDLITYVSSKFAPTEQPKPAESTSAVSKSDIIFTTPAATVETPSTTTEVRTKRPYTKRSEKWNKSPKLDGRLTMFYVWNLLSWMYTKNSSSITLPVTHKKVNGGKPLNKALFEKYMETVKEDGVMLSYSFNPLGTTRTGDTVTFFSLNNTLLSLAEIGKRKYGLIFNTAGITRQKPLEEARKEARETIVELTPEQKTVVWVVAGILKEYSNQQLNIFDLCKNAKEKYNLDVNSGELTKIIARVPEIHHSKNGTNLVALNKSLIGDDVWELVTEKYSPEHKTRSFLARISMTLPELQYFFPKSEVVSQISTSDAIYKVVHTDTETDKLALLVLRLGFRGTDMILDPEVEKAIMENLLPAVKDSLMQSNPLFRLEHLTEELKK